MRFVRMYSESSTKKVTQMERHTGAGPSLNETANGVKQNRR